MVAARHPDLPVVTEARGGPHPRRPRDRPQLGAGRSSSDRGRGGFSSHLLGSVQRAVAAGATTPVVVVHGPAEATRHADLVVIGGRRAPGYLGPTLGRTTLGPLQHAHCPVELIPRHGPGHGSTT
ncbi:hypothetical protein GCM10017752_07260 [Streptomyces roseoviridis]